jgi:hypothetical protein
MISTAAKSAAVETAATHVASAATHVTAATMSTTAAVPAAAMGKSGDRDECNRAGGNDCEERNVKMKRS